MKIPMSGFSVATSLLERGGQRVTPRQLAGGMLTLAATETLPMAKIIAESTSEANRHLLSVSVSTAGSQMARGLTAMEKAGLASQPSADQLRSAVHELKLMPGVLRSGPVPDGTATRIDEIQELVADVLATL